MVVSIVFLSSANLICRSTDISKCFIESLGFRDNESRLYIPLFISTCFSITDNHKDEKKVVLVFSNLGISRSATVVIAYLMKVKQWSLKVSFT